MKKFIVLSSSIFILLQISTGLAQNSNSISTDSLTLMQAFEKIKTNKTFLKDLSLEKEKQYQYSDMILKPFFGDLNNDGILDGLISFSIENRGGGNNFDVHHAVFLKENNQWIYQCQLDAQIGAPNRIFGIKEIKKGIVMGNIFDNSDDKIKIPSEYILKNKELVNTYTKLHKMEADSIEYLHINEILSPNNIVIPTISNLKIYQDLLGLGRIVYSINRPECGTYFDNGKFRELIFPNLRFEIENSKKAAWIQLEFNNEDYRFNTNKGTITRATTLKELKNIFNYFTSYQLLNGEDGEIIFRVKEGYSSDNSLDILYGKDGKIIRITLFIPC